MTANKPPRRWLRSVVALLSGMFVGAVLSLGTDQILHVLEVYPPWGQPMHDPGLNLLALSYRVVYNAIGCYLAARLAPSSPMRHAMILGWLGFVVSLMGAIAMWDFGPHWYPIILAITCPLSAWVGARLYLGKTT